MRNVVSLQPMMESWAGDDEHRLAISRILKRIAAAVSGISCLIQEQAAGGAAMINGSPRGEEGSVSGPAMNAILHDALGDGLAASSGYADGRSLAQTFPDVNLAVTMDPLNGADLDANVPVGTIFSIWPSTNEPAAPAWLGKGSEQLAAGFAIYGPRTALVLTVRQGVQIFTLDIRTSQFNLTGPAVRVPRRTYEYAVNAAHYRHWDRTIREYVDDCLNGVVAFNMRWTGSLVAEAYRVLVRGGICLYPRDTQPGCEQGPLRRVHEANPIALLMEEAGGAATDGSARVLEMPASSLRERSPLVFGSADEVDRVRRHHTELCLGYGRSPLFANRGLFQRQERL